MRLILASLKPSSYYLIIPWVELLFAYQIVYQKWVEQPSSSSARSGASLQCTVDCLPHKYVHETRRLELPYTFLCLLGKIDILYNKWTMYVTVKSLLRQNSSIMVRDFLSTATSSNLLGAAVLVAPDYTNTGSTAKCLGGTWMSLSSWIASAFLLSVSGCVHVPLPKVRLGPKLVP